MTSHSQIVVCSRDFAPTTEVEGPAVKKCKIKMMAQVDLKAEEATELRIDAVPRPVEPLWRPPPQQEPADAAPGGGGGDEEDAGKMRLEREYKMVVRKSAVYGVYTPKFVGRFRAHPQEEVVEVSWRGCVSNKEENMGGEGTVCEVQKDARTGEVIRGSGGFCCQRGLGHLLGISSQGRRNKGATTLHCLRWRKNDPWWTVYSLLMPELFFTVDVRVMRRLPPGRPGTGAGGAAGDSASSGAVAADDGGVTVEGDWEEVAQMELSPQMAMSRFAAGDAEDEEIEGIVRLVGSFELRQQMRTFEDAYLVLPSGPGGRKLAEEDGEDLTAVGVDLAEDEGRDMTGEGYVLERVLFDLDGEWGGCNKIGVSHLGFSRQGSRCEVPQGSCLRGQLEDVSKEEDKVKRKLCGGEWKTKMGFFGEGSKSIGCKIEGTHNTEIAMEIDGRKISVIVGDPIGKITQAYAVLNDVTSDNDDMHAIIEVTNLSLYIEGGFQVAIDCELDDKRPVSVDSVQTFRLDPQQSHTLHFRFIRNGLSELNNKNAQCLATLSGLSEGKIIDQRNFPLHIKPMVISVPQLSLRPPDGFVAPSPPFCAARLKFADVYHAVSRGCYDRLGVWAVLILVGMLGIIWGSQWATELVLWLAECGEAFFGKTCNFCGKTQFIKTA